MKTTFALLILTTSAGVARAQDTTAPVITCPEDATLPADESCAASLTGPAATATDEQDEDVTVLPELPVALDGTGEHVVTWTATDDAGNSATCDQLVTVQDMTEPTVALVSATPLCLWPPNHRFVAFRFGDNVVVETSDNCDEAPAIEVGGIQSSEPENGRGDGNTFPDSLIGSDGFCLRAERSGGGDGREYTVDIQAVDDSGNASAKTLENGVGVAHDQRAHDCPALEDSAFVEEDDPACTIVGDGGTIGARGETREAAGCSIARPSPSGTAIGLLLSLVAIVMRKKVSARAT